MLNKVKNDRGRSWKTLFISYGVGAGIWTRVRRIQINRSTIWAIIHWPFCDGLWNWPLFNLWNWPLTWYLGIRYLYSVSWWKEFALSLFLFFSSIQSSKFWYSWYSHKNFLTFFYFVRLSNQTIRSALKSKTWDYVTVLEEYAARGTGVCFRLEVPPGYKAK